MDRAERLPIEWVVHQDAELKQHVDEHRKLKEMLETMSRRRHLTSEEQIERKNLQKQKLRKKEKIIGILDKYQT